MLKQLDSQPASAQRMALPLRLISAIAAIAIGLLTLAACGSAETIGAEREAPEPLPTPIPAPSGTGPNGEQMSLEVVDVANLSLITNSSGMAVYGNERESIDEIVCLEQDCTSVWVPLEPREAFISARLDATLYQVVARPDGIEQVAYDGVPLYTWSGDSLVGYPQGSGIAGIWFALTADGQRVQ